MKDELPRKMFIYLSEKFLKESNQITGKTSQYFSDLEKNEVKNRERRIKANKKRIKVMEDELEKLKSDKQASKDPAVKNRISRLKEEMKKESSKGKDLKKHTSRLPGEYKRLKSDFESGLKTLSKSLQDLESIDFKRIKTSRLNDTLLGFIPRIAEEMNNLDEIALTDELFEAFNIEFTILHLTGSIDVKSQHAWLALAFESLFFNLLSQALYEEKTTSRKEALIRHAVSAGKSALILAGKSKMKDLIEFYEKFLVLLEIEYLKVLGIQEFEKHQYGLATGQFVQALAYIQKIKDFEPIKAYLGEQELYLTALASDANNLIYLLSSYKNWSVLHEVTGDETIKELGQISKESIEAFVTPLYGFPKDAEIEKITQKKQLNWPKPKRSPKLDEIEPIFS